MSSIVIILNLLYLFLGTFPAEWYFSREQLSRWYLLIPLIGIGLSIVAPSGFEADRIRFFTWAILQAMTGPLFWPLMIINLLSIAGSIVVIYYNPKLASKNAGFRRLGIICFYIAYVINGPWWWIILGI